MSLSASTPQILIIKDQVERINITVTDTTTDPPVAVDPYSLSISLYNDSETQIFTSTYGTPGTRVMRTGTGLYYVDIGNQMVNNETNEVGMKFIIWNVQLVNGGEITKNLQNLRIVSMRTLSFLPDLKLLIDKSHKLVNPAYDVYLGYTDAQLMHWIDGGLGYINAYQPSVNYELETYPYAFKQLLLESALIIGVISQTLYAVDTDIPNYNDQGTSFVIQHQPQLAAFLNQLSQRLDKQIPMMKLQHLQSGSVHTQMGPNFRLQQLINASPNGSLFRGLYFRA